MISGKFQKVEKFTESNSKLAVSFGSDGRISFSEKCWSGVNINGGEIRVEPRLLIERKDVEKVVEVKGSEEKRLTTTKKTIVKKLAFVFEKGTKENKENPKLQAPKVGKQKYISGKGYIQKNDFLRHLMTQPVVFQHDAISFDETKGHKNNVIIVDLLKKGRNKYEK